MARTLDKEDIEVPEKRTVNVGRNTGTHSRTDCSGDVYGCYQVPNSERDRSAKRPLCMKCRDTVAVVAARQKDPLCKSCAFESAAGKTRHALRLKVGLTSADTVMVCLSGGHCSRAMLHFLLDTQSLNKTRPGRSKIAFDLLVAFVEEGAIFGSSVDDSDARISAVWESVKHSISADQFVSLRLEDVFLAGPGAESAGLSRIDRRARLEALLQAVPDATGREDLVKALRERLLLAAAASRMVTMLARGDSSDRLAARVIALSAKGCGFALPSTLHFLDARHGRGSPIWISPVRELMAKDLAVMTHLLRLRTLPGLEAPAVRGVAPSINALAERFVAGLQTASPSSVHTILATACKLQRFSWNSQVGLSEGSQDIFSGLCAICSAPMQHAEQDRKGVGGMATSSCRSCQQQFLGVSPSGAGAAETATSSSKFEELLPDALLETLRRGESKAAKSPEAPFSSEKLSREKMRDQLRDCLLENDE